MLPCFWRCEADNGGMLLSLAFCARQSMLCSGCCCLSSVLLLSARAGEDLLKSSEDAAAGLSAELTITLYEMLGRQSEWWALFSPFSSYPGSEVEMDSCSSQNQQQKPRFSSFYLSPRIYIYVCVYLCVYIHFFQISLHQFYIYIHFFQYSSLEDSFPFKPEMGLWDSLSFVMPWSKAGCHWARWLRSNFIGALLSMLY